MTQDFKSLIEENFGKLNGQQLWALVKLSKNVRLRCRNNTAFNNFMNQTFPYARFQQVNKTRKNRYTGAEETYPGLQITVNQEVVNAEEGEE
jgi:hypothetical protein